jgi:hypothetical protein
MRTSLNEIKDIERYLEKDFAPEESLLFEAKLLTQPGLHLHTQLQRRIVSLVKIFHRKKMKQDLEQIHQRLFTDPSRQPFQQIVQQYFNS